ncbi:MAG: hypothetical protein ABR867_02500 [Nitrososphaerales archaeon]|jgi:hypothetical protein
MVAPRAEPLEARVPVCACARVCVCARAQFYSKMVEKYRASDVVTHEIFEDLLKDEVDGEEQWEKFLAGL